MIIRCIIVLIYNDITIMDDLNLCLSTRAGRISLFANPAPDPDPANFLNQYPAPDPPDLSGDLSGYPENLLFWVFFKDFRFLVAYLTLFSSYKHIISIFKALEQAFRSI